MSKKSEFNQRKLLKKNVIDDVTYTKKQRILGWLGLIIGLWGVFFTFVAMLFFMSQGLWGPVVKFTAPTILK